MSETALSDWVDVVRVLTDDVYDVQRRSDEQIQRGLRTAVKLNKLPNYALTDDGLSVTPEITDPNKFALLAYYTVELFLAPEAHSYATRRRAQARSFGDRYRFLTDLQSEILRLENGTMFIGWQSYLAFFEGKVNLPLWAELTDVKVQAPVQTIAWNTHAP